MTTNSSAQLSVTHHAGMIRLRDWWSRNQIKIVPYLFIAPNMFVFTLFVFAPIVYAGYMGFFKWNGISKPEFASTQNYVKLFEDEVFVTAFKNNLYYAAMVIPTSMGLGLLVALALNMRLPGRAILRTLYFLPQVVSAVATGTTAAWMFNDSYGVINKLLVEFGFEKQHWLTSPDLALETVAISTVWVRLGFCMIVYLAGLQSIPQDYTDAAKVDGASQWQRFRHVTWPLLSSTTFLLLILNVISSFEAFDLVFVMTGGGPGYSTTVLPIYVYTTAFQTQRMGYASAVGLVLMAFIMAFTLIQWRLSRQSEGRQ